MKTPTRIEIVNHNFATHVGINHHQSIMDVEASSRQRVRNTPVDNPYSDNAAPLHYWHPINVLRRGGYIGVSLYGLHYFNAYETIMRDPSVSHEWFKFAIAASVGTF